MIQNHKKWKSDPSSNSQLLHTGYNFRWGEKTLPSLVWSAMKPLGLQGVELKQNNVQIQSSSSTVGILEIHIFNQTSISIVSVSYWRGIICMREYLQHLCSASWPTWRYQPLHWQNATALWTPNQNFSAAHNLNSKQCETRQRVKIVHGRPWIAVGRLI